MVDAALKCVLNGAKATHAFANGHIKMDMLKGCKSTVLTMTVIMNLQTVDLFHRQLMHKIAGFLKTTHLGIAALSIVQSSKTTA